MNLTLFDFVTPIQNKTSKQINLAIKILKLKKYDLTIDDLMNLEIKRK